MFFHKLLASDLTLLPQDDELLDEYQDITLEDLSS